MFLGLLILLGILANGGLIHGLFNLGTSQQVYVRNLMFSEIISETQRVDLNQVIEKGFKRDTDVGRYVEYLHPDGLKKLTEKSYRSDRDMAWAIVDVIGRADGSVCGLETLGSTVFETRQGKGCCSDYSKAWMFYANLLGLPAREVSLFNHTTVEYLERATGRWHWLDPFNHTEIVNALGQVLSLLEVRNARYGDGLRIEKNLGSPSAFDANGYVGYSRAQMGVVFFCFCANFLEVEAWDRRMHAWSLPKNIRQLVTLVAGVQPRWLMLTTHADYFYYKLLRSLIWMLLYFWLTLNVVWIIAAFLLGKKIFAKQHQFSV